MNRDQRFHLTSNRQVTLQSVQCDAPAEGGQ